MWGATAYSFVYSIRGGGAAPQVLKRYKKGRAHCAPLSSALWLLSHRAEVKIMAQSLLAPLRESVVQNAWERWLEFWEKLLGSRRSYLIKECMDLGSAKPTSYPEKDDAKTEQTNKQTNNFLMSTVHYDLLNSNLKFLLRLHDLTF